MNKLEKINNDPSHKARPTPKSIQFDNNYLYYLYCSGSISSNYDEARIYLHENISQIVQASKPGNINIPYDLHDDLNTEMFLIVDELYRNIFEDEKILKIVDQEGNQREGTRFEKYYHTHQVYGYLKLVVSKRILTYFGELKKENESRPLQLDEAVFFDNSLQADMKGMNDKIACDMLVRIILETILSISEIEKFIFICIHLQSRKIEEVSRMLSEQGYDYSVYKIKKISQKIISRMRRVIDRNNFVKEDFI